MFKQLAAGNIFIYYSFIFTSIRTVYVVNVSKIISYTEREIKRVENVKISSKEVVFVWPISVSEDRGTPPPKLHSTLCVFG